MPAWPRLLQHVAQVLRPSKETVTVFEVKLLTGAISGSCYEMHVIRVQHTTLCSALVVFGRLGAGDRPEQGMLYVKGHGHARGLSILFAPLEFTCHLSWNLRAIYLGIHVLSIPSQLTWSAPRVCAECIT